MKIIVRTRKKNTSLRLPGWLVYGRLSLRIANAAIARHAPDCGVSPEMLGEILSALRDFSRTHPGWELVNIQTHDGEHIRITL